MMFREIHGVLSKSKEEGKDQKSIQSNTTPDLGHHLSRDMRFPTMWYVRLAKASDQPAHTRSLIRAFSSRVNIL